MEEKDHSDILKPLETVLPVKIFTGCKLNKFFRRYFSDDEFEIKGKIKDNFKAYFLSSVEAIDPKSTPITPEPPSYFFYTNEKKG